MIFLSVLLDTARDTARLAHDKIALDVISNIKSKVEKESKASGKDISLDNDIVLNIIKKERKELQETLDAAILADRPALIEETKLKIAYINKFIPEELTEEEIKKRVKNAFQELHFSNIGQAMKHCMAKLGSECDKKMLSKIVKDTFSEFNKEN